MLTSSMCGDSAEWKLEGTVHLVKFKKYLLGSLLLMSHASELTHYYLVVKQCNQSDWITHNGQAM